MLKKTNSSPHDVFKVFFLLVCTIVFLSGCDLVQTLLSQDSGKLEITLPTGKYTEKLLKPDISLIIDRYEISLSSNDYGALGPYTGEPGEIVSIPGIPQGYWLLKVNGLNDIGEVLTTGTDTVMITGGQTTETSISMAPLSGQGELNLSLSWPVEFVTEPHFTATLTDSAGNSVSFEGVIDEVNGTATSSLLLEQGYYTLIAKMYDGTDQIWGTMESVYIVAEQQTTGVVTLDDDDFLNYLEGDLVVSISGDQNRPFEVTLTADKLEIIEDETVTLNAEVVGTDSSPYIYKWYINGNKVSDADSSNETFSVELALGKNNVAVLAHSDSIYVSESIIIKKALSINPPENITITSTMTTQEISWDTVEKAETYNVYQDVTAGGTFDNLLYSGSSSNYINSGLDMGSTYYYKVEAVDSLGIKANSDVISASTKVKSNLKIALLNPDYKRIVKAGLYYSGVEVDEVAGLNVALQPNGGSATAGSYGSYMDYVAIPEAAIDGEDSTFWAGTRVPDWFQVEFNDLYRIDRVVVNTYYQTQTYSVLLSVDGEDWETIVLDYTTPDTVPSGEDDTYIKEFTFDPVLARYIKINFTGSDAAASHIYKTGLIELEAYNASSVPKELYSIGYGRAIQDTDHHIEYENLSGFGTQEDFIESILTDSGYQIDTYTSCDFLDIDASQYDLIIMQDPIQNHFTSLNPDIYYRNPLPDLIENVCPVLINKLNEYIDQDGKVFFVGDAVDLLENGGELRLNRDKTIIDYSVENSQSNYHEALPAKWLFIRGNPFCGVDRTGSETYTVSASTILETNAVISTQRLFNGNDIPKSVIWCDTFYKPSDAVSLIDISIQGTGEYVMSGAICSPPVYFVSVNETVEGVAGYTLVDDRKFYYLGSDSFFDYSFASEEGVWHAGQALELENTVTDQGKNLISELVYRALEEWY